MEKESLDIKFESPLNIPEHKQGDYSIKHGIVSKGSELTVISIRNAIMMGVRPKKALLESDWLIHKLYNGNQLLMSDCPQETFLFNKSIKNAYDRVLVGGLGLGYYPSKLLIENKKVTGITVVEKEKDIIDLVQPYLDPCIKVVHEDLFEYLKNKSLDFDYAYYDIWYGTSESDWLDYVLPLRRLTWRYHGKRSIDCWGEQEMITQIIQGGISVIEWYLQGNKKIDMFKGWLPKYAVIKRFLEKGRLGNTEINTFVSSLVKNIGSPKWEKFWRWDELLEECKVKNE